MGRLRLPRVRGSLAHTSRQYDLNAHHRHSECLFFAVLTCTKRVNGNSSVRGTHGTASLALPFSLAYGPGSDSIPAREVVTHVPRRVDGQHEAGASGDARALPDRSHDAGGPPAPRWLGSARNRTALAEAVSEETGVGLRSALYSVAHLVEMGLVLDNPVRLSDMGRRYVWRLTR